MTHEEWVLKKLEDVGSRWEHYSDLISLWEDGCEVIRKKKYPSNGDENRVSQMEAALDMLQKTLDGMTAYHDNQIILRKLVDHVPTVPEAIEGGRGTPLQLKLLANPEEQV